MNGIATYDLDTPCIVVGVNALEPEALIGAVSTLAVRTLEELSLQHRFHKLTSQPNSR